MTREEFDKLYLDKVVHCDTEKKANHFLVLADSVGYKWFSGGYLTGRNFWETNEKETYYHITNDGLLFGNINYIKQDNYQIIEYTLPHELKEGDKVRIKDPSSTYTNEKVGVIIEKNNSLERTRYLVEINDGDYHGIWYYYENELEKIEETINNIIKEIKEYQERIIVLLNCLEQEMK